MSTEWKLRIKLFIQRFWQPTSACMTCMPGSWGNIMSLSHWVIAFHTGLLTGLLAVILTFTPAAKLYSHRYGNALIVGLLTMLGDAYAHASHYRIPYVEHIVTGVISGLLALAASYLFEDRARRVRAAWPGFSDDLSADFLNPPGRAEGCSPVWLRIIAGEIRAKAAGNWTPGGS
jgi:hypothetical protein